VVSDTPFDGATDTSSSLGRGIIRERFVGGVANHELYRIRSLLPMVGQLRALKKLLWE